jgi:hypothetical protein
LDGCLESREIVAPRRTVHLVGTTVWFALELGVEAERE